MFENYKVAVKVSLVDSVSAPLLLIARQFATTHEAAKKLQTQLNSIKLWFAGGALTFGAGAGLAAPLLYAIDKAAELQKQMIGVQIATRGTAQQMESMRGVIEKVASTTVFSNIDVAKMAKLVATGTGLGAKDVQGLLPVYAQFADVQLLMKGTGYEESTKEAIRLAHTAKHYDPASLSKYLDLLTKASFIVPGSLSEVGHALKYSQGVGNTALGVNDENMVLMTALLNRMGFAGSRGGTNLIAAMTRTIPGIFGSGLMTGKSGEALNAMGMISPGGKSKVFKDGKFDAFSWMGLLGEYVQREFARNPEAGARQNIMKNFQHAFGTQGSRVASLLSDPQALEQLRAIGEVFAQYGGTEGIQKKFADESVSQQWMNAKTNFVSAMTELGITLLPTASKALKIINGHMQHLIEWMTKNPEKVKEFALGMAVLSATLLGFGSLAILVSGFKALGLALNVLTLGAAGGALGTVATGISAIAAAVAPWVLGAGAAGAAGYGVATALGLGDVGGWIGRKAYDWMHPENDGGIKPASRTSSGKVTVIHMDGKLVGEIVSGHQARAAYRPQTGTSFFDGTQALFPAGGSTGRY